MFERDRTKPFLIRYALYLYFLGLSLRNTSKALEPFVEKKLRCNMVLDTGIQSKASIPV
jgi:hypothetical protein